jgi:hypothetical protein
VRFFQKVKAWCAQKYKKVKLKRELFFNFKNFQNLKIRFCGADQRSVDG